MSRRLVVGLTGTFGSGKSTVGKFFRRLGVHVLDADRLVHEALRKNSAAYRKIKRLFDPSILKTNGEIDRHALAAQIFQSTQKRRKLEHIIHPYVFRRIRESVRKVRTGIVIVEIPLLFETHYDKYLDRAITVNVGKRRLIRRLRARNFSLSEIEARLKAQLPLPVKVKKSDFVINNNNELDKTLKETQRVWVQLKKEVY